ncbi:hypothetical protein DENIS_3892 [Desulfonema ishimotonii]|uniref:Uncharacterized protein n=1 Tax=Desulfonema ishimotonii TaxID=45657 RepID=A0A401G0Z4_9BACT|nr:hypothetical protein [Desulfonema ishimotonii]GBC62908.1 hypothetical protein DENIS_3892 [Desulfonema ishimotonii]
MALELAKRTGITNEHEARETANRITKQTTGVDLLRFVRPGYNASESLQKTETEKPLIRFLNAWWEKYGEEAVDSHYMRRMIPEAQGNKRSQKIRLSRMLGKIKGQEIASYYVSEAGIYRNSKLWKLKSAGK